MHLAVCFALGQKLLEKLGGIVVFFCIIIIILDVRPEDLQLTFFEKYLIA